jgi:hypothetical protein
MAWAENRAFPIIAPAYLRTEEPSPAQMASSLAATGPEPPGGEVSCRFLSTVGRCTALPEAVAGVDVQHCLSRAKG